ncbi:hypothetical protein EHQ58_18430 [Leptospira ognonensis]|uniref:Uncharacterized protein n=1 Tax=Leptospira ognonensis TaxID=2484945 RepID=A0A4R9JUX1_9LEPT|nr:hypothetical protein [Leptospira ognonensis]TGL55699.1 hypothetical protein EHQ58_18430 [Leptospira ognonensis]
MTWDIFLIDFYCRILSQKEEKEEFLFASEDKALKFLLKTIIQVNIAQDLEIIKPIFSSKDQELLELTIKINKNFKDIANDQERKITSSSDFEIERRKQTIHLEKKIYN